MSRFLAAVVAVAFFVSSFLTLNVQAEEQKQPSPPSEQEIQRFFENVKAKLHPKGGVVDLPGGMVKLNLPQDFLYYSPEDTRIVLEDVWGNPPGKPTLGMIMPKAADFTSKDGWAVLLSYNDDGHVNDSDAKTINYSELLQQMKDGTEEENKERQQQGYPAIHMLGWAEAPHYDEKSHKLYWAKEFTSSDSEEHYLNYDVRALGREGVFVMSVIGTMRQLPMIDANKDKILAMVDFNDTHKYEDFNASTDRVAAYGMGAMIAAGVAAKTGLFKGILVALVAAKKFVVLAVLAVIAFVKKLFSRKK